MSPEVLLYLVVGLAAVGLARAALPALRHRRQAPAVTTPSTVALPQAVRSVVAQDFPAEERAEVERLLGQYGDDETERVQLAILHLAKGSRADVASHVSAARQDYRDVLYWAYYYEDDPHRLLRDLLGRLEDARQLSADEVRSVLRASRGTLYGDAFEKLCEIMVRNDTRLSREAYEQLDRLGKIVKQPEQLWAPLEKNVT